MTRQGGRTLRAGGTGWRSRHRRFERTSSLPTVHGRAPADAHQRARSHSVRSPTRFVPNSAQQPWGLSCGRRPAHQDKASSLSPGVVAVLRCCTPHFVQGRSRQLAVQAELVALGVLHHDRPRPAVSVLIHDLRAKRNQALGLRRLAILVDVDRRPCRLQLGRVRLGRRVLAGPDLARLARSPGRGSPGRPSGLRCRSATGPRGPAASRPSDPAGRRRRLTVAIVTR